MVCPRVKVLQMMFSRIIDLENFHVGATSELLDKGELMESLGRYGA